MNAPSKPLLIVERLARAYALDARQSVGEQQISQINLGWSVLADHVDDNMTIFDAFKRIVGREMLFERDADAGRCTPAQCGADEALARDAIRLACESVFWFDGTKIERVMTSIGYSETQTGGGCTAYERILPSGKRIMVTDDDPSVPYWGGSIVVGLYPPNEEECSEALAYAMLAFEEPAEHPESLDDAPAGQYGVDYYSGERPVIDESSAPAELLDEVRAIIAGLNAVSGPADADVTPKYAPGTVGAEVSPVFRMVLHPEILAIEATSCVGESVVELCRAVGTVLALRTPDHEGPGSSIDPEHRATLLAVVRDQSNLWYFG